MSELDSKQPHYEDGRLTTGEEPRKPEADSWERTTVPMLWFMTPYIVVRQIAKMWLPEYLAVGIACFLAALVVFRFGGPRFRRYGVGKSVRVSLLLSTVLSIVALAVSALWSALFRI